MYFLVNDGLTVLDRLNMYSSLRDGKSINYSIKPRVFDSETFKVHEMNWSFVSDHLNEFCVKDCALCSIEGYLRSNEVIRSSKLTLGRDSRWYRIGFPGIGSFGTYNLFGFGDLVYFGVDQELYVDLKQKDRSAVFSLSYVRVLGKYVLARMYSEYASCINFLFSGITGEERAIWGSAVDTPVAVDYAELSKFITILGVD